MDSSQLLDDDILEKIARDHLPTFSDRIQFSLVCKLWNSLAFRRRPQPLPGLLSRETRSDEYQFLPFSLLDFTHKDYGDGYVCPYGCRETGAKPANFINPAVRRPIKTLPIVPLPIPNDEYRSYFESYRRRYRGENKTEANHIVTCLYGWLLIANPRPTSGNGCLQLQLYLLNPITRASIGLPRRPPTLDGLLSSRRNIIKAVLSSSPDNIQVDCHVIVLLKSSPNLAWCNVLGEGRGWKLLSNYIFETRPEDMSYHGETLYVLDSNNVYIVRDLIVTSSDRNYSVRAVSLSSLPVNDYPFAACLRLAPDLAGQLLIIYDCGEPAYESVYKLVVSSSSSREYKWERVRSLDGYALFVGTNNQSFCLAACDDHNGVMSNRIYFPSGVFDLEFGCFAPFSDPYGLVQTGYFWFQPMFRDVIGEHMKSEKGVGMRNCKSKFFSYWTDHKEERVADSKVSVDGDMKNNRFQALLSNEE